MKHNIYLNTLLKRAMGDETPDLFSINAGLQPFEMDDILRGIEKPDRNTLLKIASHARNGVDYQMLKDAMKEDEKTVIDEDDRDVHYLLNTREEDLEEYFKEISRACIGNAMDSDTWLLIWMLDELRDMDIYVDEKFRKMYSAEYSGEKRRVGNRVYRDVKFSLPDGNLMYIVTGTASWLPEEDGKIRDCRFILDDIESHVREKTMHERIDEIRQDLKDYCAESVKKNSLEIPVVKEGYGFYIDDAHLKQAETFCGAHKDLWPKDLKKAEDFSEYDADPQINGTWQLVAGIMRSLYGIPFFCYRREAVNHKIPGAQMIMILKDFIDEETDSEDEILRACYEAASAMDIPSYGTVWYLEDKTYSSVPEYPTEEMGEKRMEDDNLEIMKEMVEEDPEDLDNVVAYVEMLNDKSGSCNSSTEVKKLIQEAEELPVEALEDEEVWDQIAEMQKTYRSFLRKENLKSLMEEMGEKIKQEPDSPKLLEQYLAVVKKYVPYTSYEESKELVDTLVEVSDAAMDCQELLDLIDQLKEQTVRNDPYQENPETKQIVHYIRDQYEHNPTMKNAEAYALFLYLNEKDPDRIHKMKKLYHQNLYNLYVAEKYASMMNRDVIHDVDHETPIQKLEDYEKELSPMNEKFYSSEIIGMADHNISLRIHMKENMVNKES